MPDYRFVRDSVSGSPAPCIERVADKVFIPFDMGNRDISRFLADWKAAATVDNPDGSPATFSDAAVIALGLTPPADPEE